MRGLGMNSCKVASSRPQAHFLFSAERGNEPGAGLSSRGPRLGGESLAPQLASSLMHAILIFKVSVPVDGDLEYHK